MSTGGAHGSHPPPSHPQTTEEVRAVSPRLGLTHLEGGARSRLGGATAVGSGGAAGDASRRTAGRSVDLHAQRSTENPHARRTEAGLAGQSRPRQGQWWIPSPDGGSAAGAPGPRGPAVGGATAGRAARGGATAGRGREGRGQVLGRLCLSKGGCRAGGPGARSGEPTGRTRCASASRGGGVAPGSGLGLERGHGGPGSEQCPSASAGALGRRGKRGRADPGFRAMRRAHGRDRHRAPRRSRSSCQAGAGAEVLRWHSAQHLGDKTHSFADCARRLGVGWRSEKGRAWLSTVLRSPGGEVY